MCFFIRALELFGISAMMHLKQIGTNWAKFYLISQGTNGARGSVDRYFIDKS